LELKFLNLRLTLYNRAGEETLRAIPLTTINGQATAEFWAARDAHRKEIEDLPKQIETYRAAGLVFTAEQQVEFVRRKLRELNPGYNGELQYLAEEGNVVELYLNPGTGNATVSAVWDLSAVRVLPLLNGLDFHFASVSDLSPLAGMPLTGLGCDGTPISDLSALAGARLTHLECIGTRISDLSPLKGMPLTHLTCNGTRISDLSPLAGMLLKHLDCDGTRISDLSPLKGMPLTHLACSGTRISDLSPLAGMPLTSLGCFGTQVSELSPLKGMPWRLSTAHRRLFPTFRRSKVCR